MRAPRPDLGGQRRQVSRHLRELLVEVVELAEAPRHGPGHALRRRHRGRTAQRCAVTGAAARAARRARTLPPSAGHLTRMMYCVKVLLPSCAVLELMTVACSGFGAVPKSSRGRTGMGGCVAGFAGRPSSLEAAILKMRRDRVGEVLRSVAKLSSFIDTRAARAAPGAPQRSPASARFAVFHGDELLHQGHKAPLARRERAAHLLRARLVVPREARAPQDAVELHQRCETKLLLKLHAQSLGSRRR